LRWLFDFHGPESGAVGVTALSSAHLTEHTLPPSGKDTGSISALASELVMTTANRRFIRTFLITVACSVTAAPSLLAQGVQGFVSGPDRKPVAGALVRLMKSDAEITRTFADSGGGFLIRINKGGSYRIEASHIGHEKVLTQELSLERGRIAEVMIHMGVRPVELPALVIRGQRKDVREQASYEGMLARKAAQKGPLASKITLRRGDPEFDSSTDVRDVLAWVPRARCVRNVYWNGHGTLSGNWLMELNTAHIDAVEWFRDELSAPREFRNNAFNAVPPVERLFTGGSAMASDPSAAELRGKGLGRAGSAGRTTSGCAVIAIWSHR
jgi:hypothetical protein